MDLWEDLWETFIWIRYEWEKVYFILIRWLEDVQLRLFDSIRVFFVGFKFSFDNGFMLSVEQCGHS